MKSTGLQLTSLIDVMMFLVIFFMLSTSFVIIESLELTLPSEQAVSVDTKPVVADKETLTLTIQPDGMIGLNEASGSHALEQDALIGALAERLKNNPKRRVVVLCGPEIAVQSLVAVMDAVYQSGGRNLAVARLGEPEAPAAAPASDPALMNIIQGGAAPLPAPVPAKAAP